MQAIPYGYCHCGCGEKTRLAPRTDAGSGWVKGEPLRYIRNHHRRKRVDDYYLEEDLGYVTPCWVWQATTRDGYGRIIREGRTWQASHWHYVKVNGPVPEGMQLDHLCHQHCAGGPDCPHRGCVNPDHLEPVPQKTNVQRGFKTRGPLTHCRRGHEFTPENTILQKGGRTCRICDNAKQRRYYERRKAAGL